MRLISGFLRDIDPICKLIPIQMPSYGYSVYIGGLSDRVRTRDVEDFLRGYGKILDISLKTKYGE